MDASFDVSAHSGLGRVVINMSGEQLSFSSTEVEKKHVSLGLPCVPIRSVVGWVGGWVFSRDIALVNCVCIIAFLETWFA